MRRDSSIGCGVCASGSLRSGECFRHLAFNMSFARHLCFVIAFACPLGLLRAQVRAAAPPLDDPKTEQRITKLLGQMTLEEKIGQLVHFADSSTGPGAPHPDYREQVAQGNVGSLENITGAAETNALQKLAIEKSRLHIPLLFALDVIHGYRTIFPVPLAMASTWDPLMVERASRIAAKEATREGIRQTYSPMVDIARDARWGRIVEGAGEDPYLGSAMARAQVKGFQGEHLNPDGTVVCVKHFAAYGASEGGRDYDSVYVPEELLENVYLVPFHAAEQAGAGSFMSAYMDLNEVPASGNHWLLTDVLRKDWGFQGFVLSDAFAVGSLVTHHYAKDGEDAAYKALSAGVNMDMASLTYVHNLAQAVKHGKITESYIDQMVLPILETKYDLGLFEHPYADASRVESVLSRPEGLKLERKLAGRSMVLLKNDNHTLPLQKSLR